MTVAARRTLPPAVTPVDVAYSLLDPYTRLTDADQA
jgi:hypothetical protein